MMALYDNPFSPFARKVRMVLFLKGIDFESVDALAFDNLPSLEKANLRCEVPVLIDGAIRVINSADIVAYLDHRYGPPLVLPADPVRRVAARAWERLSDSVVDAIIHDMTIWSWRTHNRPDVPPAGLIEAGHRDLRKLLRMLEGGLASGDFLCGELSIADIALYPHASSLRLLGLPPDPKSYPRVYGWLDRMRALPFVRRDIERVRQGVAEKLDLPVGSHYEGKRILWRGDRLEWLLANGFHTWWTEELAAGRVAIPRSL